MCQAHLQTPTNEPTECDGYGAYENVRDRRGRTDETNGTRDCTDVLSLLNNTRMAY